MWDIILLFSSICTVVVGAPVTGYRGERADIRCPYESGYESNPKYLCKGECRDRHVIVKSGSRAKDQRFSLRDNRTTRVFTVTITDLRSADEGRYWCGVERSVIKDVYSEIMLLVKQDDKTTEVSTISPFSTTLSYFSTTEPYPESSSITITERTETIPDQHKSTVSGSFMIIITAEALVLLLIVLPLIIVAVWKRNKTQGLLSSSIVEFNPVLYEQIKDAGRDCNPEDRDTETTVVYTCAS
ncbi:CMRF35-like molecule 1 [Carassius carassius]|uniref:CMRF35-like molecule 1 n=1 Tax=Carassius carassius TaxID=217509 RepID=UPI002869734D|nr:CMRF35-like molecule 1 [Carassius carassius]